MNRKLPRNKINNLSFSICQKISREIGSRLLVVVVHVVVDSLATIGLRLELHFSRFVHVREIVVARRVGRPGAEWQPQLPRFVAGRVPDRNRHLGPRDAQPLDTAEPRIAQCTLQHQLEKRSSAKLSYLLDKIC